MVHCRSARSDRRRYSTMRLLRLIYGERDACHRLRDDRRVRHGRVWIGRRAGRIGLVGGIAGFGHNDLISPRARRHPDELQDAARVRRVGQVDGRGDGGVHDLHVRARDRIAVRIQRVDKKRPVLRGALKVLRRDGRRNLDRNRSWCRAGTSPSRRPICSRRGGITTGSVNVPSKGSSMFRMTVCKEKE